MPVANKMKASAVGKAAAAVVQKPSSSSANPKKRKMDASQQKYYAVRCGVTPGVYLTWAECQANTAGFAGANCELLESFVAEPLWISLLTTSVYRQVIFVPGGGRALRGR